MRSPSLLFVSLLLFASACNHHGRSAPPPLMQADSLASTNWTLASVEGAQGAVSGSWQFDATNGYTFSFSGGGMQVQGSGSYSFDGTFLRLSGAATQALGTDAVPLLPISNSQFRVLDDDDDAWTFNGQFGSTAATSGSCIPVQQGPWEFQIEYAGLTVLEYVDGALTQSGCVLSYDDDAIFRGVLSGSQWTVNVPREGFRFQGTFTGSPARQFSGMWTDIDGRHDTITGAYVGN